MSYSTCRIDREREARDAEEKLRRMAARRAACDEFTPGMRVRIVCAAQHKGWIHKGKLATVIPYTREPRPDEHTFVDLLIDGVDYRGGCDFASPEDLAPYEDQEDLSMRMEQREQSAHEER